MIHIMGENVKHSQCPGKKGPIWFLLGCSLETPINVRNFSPSWCRMAFKLLPLTLWYLCRVNHSKSPWPKASIELAVLPIPAMLWPLHHTASQFSAQSLVLKCNTTPCFGAMRTSLLCTFLVQEAVSLLLDNHVGAIPALESIQTHQSVLPVLVWSRVETIAQAIAASSSCSRSHRCQFRCG